MIFIDRSIPKPVATALKLVRDDVSWLEDHFPHGTKDVEWLAEAGRQGWLVVVRDKHIRSRPGERQAIIDNRVGCFILNQGNDPSKWEYLKLLTSCLDEMQRLFESTPRPFICTVSRDGQFRQVLH